MGSRRTTALVLPLLVLTTFAPLAPIQGDELTANDFALNVDGFADWMTSRAFIDASSHFRRWGMPGMGWQENPRLRLTADNYPIDDADAISHLRGYPDGVYKLRYEGSGSVMFFGIAEIMVGTTKRAGDVVTADVQVTHRGPNELITMMVRNVNPKKPIRRIQLIAPGYTFEEADKLVFTREFVRRVRPFRTLRFMDWMQTNDSKIKEWSDRPSAAWFNRTQKGVPLEEIVTLANLTKASVWVNVPHAASDDYVKQFATFLRDRLHKDAVIHFEYSNELWNYVFLQARELVGMARANPKLTKPDDFGRCAQQAAEKLGQCARTFKQVFGDAEYEKRIRPVVGGFIALDYWAQQQLLWLAEKHPGLVKELGIAPYFGVEKDLKPVEVPGATADQVFDFVNAWIDERVAEWIQKHARLAREHNLALVAYEGGNHLTFQENEAMGPVKLAMQEHPRMAQTYAHLIDVWANNGGTLFTQFGHIGPYSKWGSWGLLQSLSDPGSVKWDFFMSRLLPKGDADLDGNVTGADLAIVKANFGQKGRWWEQGDFNADNVVDKEDVKRMRENLKDASAAEAAEIEALLK
jgi:hypothetical protein